MINSVILVGRVVEKPVKKTLENGSIVATLNLAVARPFKNVDGNYETDFIKCSLWEGIADSACEYLTKGSIIGLRGRLQVKNNDVTVEGNVKSIKVLDLIVERISYIKLNHEE